MCRKTILDFALQNIYLFHLCHLKIHESRITFYRGTRHRVSVVSMLLTLKSATAKKVFYIMIFAKHFMWYIIPATALKHCCIVMQHRFQ